MPLLHHPRRTLWIRLDAQEERPWDRDQFQIADLHAWTRQMRPCLLGAAVTLLRA